MPLPLPTNPAAKLGLVGYGNSEKRASMGDQTQGANEQPPMAKGRGIPDLSVSQVCFLSASAGADVSRRRRR